MITDKKFQPTNEEAADHLQQNIFMFATEEEMRFQAKTNRDLAMHAWRNSPERNGLGKTLNINWRDKWTDKEVAAEAEAFEYYDSMYWEAKVKKIPKFIEAIKAARDAGDDTVVVEKAKTEIVEANLAAAHELQPDLDS
mgnify:FL=1|tara:strand:+ start:210 stop:626 length:417 start_codon:yes stop_codon:yes gene_type:complete